MSSSVIVSYSSFPPFPMSFVPYLPKVIGVCPPASISFSNVFLVFVWISFSMAFLVSILLSIYCFLVVTISCGILLLQV